MKERLQGIARLALAGVFALCILGVAVQCVREGIEKKKSDDAAAQQVDAVRKRLASGEATRAMDDLIVIVDRYPDANVVDAPEPLFTVLSTFPPEALDYGAQQTVSRTEDGALTDLAVLCRAALVRQRPAVPQAKTAIQLLFDDGVLLEKRGTPTYDRVVEILVHVDDDGLRRKCLDALKFKGLPTDKPTKEQLQSESARVIACDVLALQGEDGWKALAAEIDRSGETYPYGDALMRAETGIARFLSSRLSAKKPEARRVYAVLLADIATDSDHPEQAAAADTLRANIEDPHVAIEAFDFYIAEGKESSIPHLVAALNEVGTVQEAEKFLNCGNAELEQAAKDWASEHGYTIESKPGSANKTWGSGN